MGNKDCLDDLEASVGAMQDEVQQINVGLTDKFRQLKDNNNRFCSFEESVNRLVESICNRESEVNAPRGGRRDDRSQPYHSVNRGENSNPFDTTHPHTIKLDFP